VRRGPEHREGQESLRGGGRVGGEQVQRGDQDDADDGDQRADAEAVERPRGDDGARDRSREQCRDPDPVHREDERAGTRLLEDGEP
jgi:hypothetical protein